MADSSSVSLIIIFVGVLLFIVTAFILCCVLCRLRGRSPNQRPLPKNRSKNDSWHERETTNVTEFWWIVEKIVESIWRRKFTFDFQKNYRKNYEKKDRLKFRPVAWTKIASLCTLFSWMILYNFICTDISVFYTYGKLNYRYCQKWLYWKPLKKG